MRDKLDKMQDKVMQNEADNWVESVLSVIGIGIMFTGLMAIVVLWLAILSAPCVNSAGDIYAVATFVLLIIGLGTFSFSSNEKVLWGNLALIAIAIVILLAMGVSNAKRWDGMVKEYNAHISEFPSREAVAIHVREQGVLSVDQRLDGMVYDEEGNPCNDGFISPCPFWEEVTCEVCKGTNPKACPLYQSLEEDKFVTSLSLDGGDRTIFLDAATLPNGEMIIQLD